ncbi:MAG: hypothetical protein IKK57_07750 [Clostridia bacterium]|nr:hypothetical protein [Clostridia bacterium]
MGKYIRATASRNFLCAWKCCSCSHVNVEEPKAEMFAREDITLLQKEAVAREKARAQANKNLEEYLDKIPTLVNEKLNFNPLEKCGKCSQCGAEQPWAVKPRYIMYLLIVVGILAAVAAISFSDFIPFVVFGGLLGLLGAIALGEFLNIRARRRAAQEITDESCRPLAITRAIPENISRDDPRLAAILVHLAAKHKSA